MNAAVQLLRWRFIGVGFRIPLFVCVLVGVIVILEGERLQANVVREPHRATLKKQMRCSTGNGHHGSTPREQERENPRRLLSSSRSSPEGKDGDAHFLIHSQNAERGHRRRSLAGASIYVAHFL